MQQVPFGDVELGQWGDPDDARVVDQNVEAAFAVLDVSHHLGPGCLVGDVEVGVTHRELLVGEGLRGGDPVVVTNVGDDDPNAGGGQRSSMGGALAAGPAGDQRDRTVLLRHIGISSVCGDVTWRRPNIGVNFCTKHCTGKTLSARPEMIRMEA